MQIRFELDTAAVLGEMDCISCFSTSLLGTSPLLLVSCVQMEFRLLFPMLFLSSLTV